MIVLADGLPMTVIIEGKTYPVVTDFRVGILNTELFSSHEFTSYEKAGQALKNFYGDGEKFPEELPIEEALEEMFLFYRRGEQVRDCGDKDPAYSFSADAGRIYSSFMSAYGIDLFSRRLHWWEFMYLLEGLPPDSPFGRCIEARTKDITRLKGKERAHWVKLKNHYALPREEKPDEVGEYLNEILKKAAKKNG